MENKKHMTLGLDLGIASVGWCLFDSDENEKPRRIIDLGSFVYNQLENGKNGKRENQVRRQKREMRRQRRRKVRRLEACRDLFAKELGVVFDFEDNNFRINGIGAKNFASPYELKIKGLTDKLNREELSIALYHYMKYRGFKSNRKSKELNNKEEKGLLLEIKKMSDERKALGENGYITNVIWNNYLEGLKTDKGNPIHNHGKEYHLTVARSEYEREINALLDKQIEFGIINEDFKQKFITLFNRQRSYSKGPGKGSPYQVDFSKTRGICSFDGNPFAIKDSYPATAFIILSKLCNFRYKSNYESKYQSLTPDQIQNSFSNTISRGDTNYTALLKDCGIDLNSVCSIKGLSLTKSEKKSIISNILKETGKQELDINDWTHYEENEKEKLLNKTFYKNSDFFKKMYDIYSPKKKNDKKISSEIIAKLNYISFVSFKYKTDEEIKNALLKPEAEGNGLKFSDDEINKILNIPYDATKTINLSQEICSKLIPEMLQGLRYDEAMKKIGYDHYNALATKNTVQPLPEIDISLKSMGVTLNNPVVKHTLVQMRKIINAVIKTYGYPTSYSIELARELKKSFEERKQIENEQKENQNENTRLKLEMMEFFPNEIRSFKDAERKENLIRYKLFKLQQAISPYTGKRIDKSKIFDNNCYQIDHILPFSRSFDDSISNKVLVETKENQEKKNWTPREYYGNNFQNIDYFVKNICHDRKKKENLLFEGDVRNRCDFSNSDSTDTSYIATLAVKLINTYLLDDESRCKTIPGAITAKLRNLWNLSGRVHSYLSTYENNCYRLRDVSNYKFRGIEFVDKKRINFVFDYVNTSCITNIIRDEGRIFSIEKIEKNDVKALKEDQKLLNNHISRVLENIDYYKNKFSDCVGKDVFSLQEKANFLSKNSYSSTTFDESISYVLAEVIKKITNECNKKNRSNDLHHALDAAIIGCITPSITKRLSDFFKKEESEVDYLTGEQKLELQLPYPDFNKEVLLRVYERDENKLISELNKLPMYKENPATKNNVHVMWPTRQQETKVVGAVSKDTICGVVELDGKKWLTTNKAVSKLTENDIKNILNINRGNDIVIKAVTDWFNQAKKDRPKYPNLPKKGVPIKSVIIKGSQLSNQPCLGESRYAENSDVVRVDVYKRKVEGDENLYFVPIYYYQIFNEKRKSKASVFYTIHKSQTIQETLSKSDLDSEYKKLFSMNRNSLIEIELNDDKGIKKGFAYSGGVTKGKLEIYSILGDNYDLYHDYLIRNTEAPQNYITVSTIKNIKIHNISILGKIS